AASDHGVKTPGRLQEKPSLDGALGDLDQSPWAGEISWISGHYADKDDKPAFVQSGAQNF
ncbi:MAG: hypothetical protein AAGM22_27675, partial [Acidobacteriota bacterium]